MTTTVQDSRSDNRRYSWALALALPALLGSGGEATQDEKAAARGSLSPGGDANTLPTGASAEYKAGAEWGLKRGRVIGRIEQLIENVDAQLKDVDAFMKKSGSPEVSEAWAANAKEIRQQLDETQKNINERPETADLEAELRSLRSNQRLLSTIQVMARSRSGSAPSEGAKASGIPGELNLNVNPPGAKVVNELADELAPLLKAHLRGMINGEKTPLIKPSEEQLKRAKDSASGAKKRLNDDVQRIKGEEAERQRKARSLRNGSGAGS